MSMLAINEHAQAKVGKGDLTISSDYLILLLELGLELGLKQSDLLLDSGLDSSILMRPGIAVGDQSFIKVVENFRRRQPDMSLATTYGKRMTLSKHGALGIVALHSRTAGAAAEAVAAYMSTRTQIFSVRRERDSESRRLYVDLEIEPSDAAYFLILAYLISIDFILRQMLGFPNHVEARIELPIQPKYWQEETLSKNKVVVESNVSGPKIYFSKPQSMLFWPSEVLNDLLPLFDKDLVSMAQGICEKELKSILEVATFGQFVTRKFKDADSNIPTIDKISAQLNTSPATLKRRLKLEGKSFREIKDEALYKKSMVLLSDKKQSIESVAEKMGYSDASNFSKAFKGWSGVTPSEFRKR